MKAGLILALLLGVFAGGAQAQQPFSCSINQAVPNLVRAEGFAELVGDVVIQCSGGTVTPAGTAVPLVNIQVFLNTNVTSKILVSGSTTFSEALLLIDEPTPAQQVTCDASGAPAAACAVKGTGVVGSSPYKVAGAANVFQGQVVGDNSVRVASGSRRSPRRHNPEPAADHSHHEYSCECQPA